VSIYLILGWGTLALSLNDRGFTQYYKYITLGTFLAPAASAARGWGPEFGAAVDLDKINGLIVIQIVSIL